MKDCRKARRVLLVEGESDLHVVLHLRSRIEQEEGSGTMPDFCIEDKGGIDPLLDSIVNEIRAPDRRAVGIVLDADEDPPKRWEAIANRLGEAGIGEVEAPVPGGMCMPESRRLPRVGVWLMPDNGSPGELEDFVQTMLPKGDPVWPSAEAYIDGIAEEHRKFRKKVLRAKVHAWTATRKQPGRMGAAIREGDLEIDGALVGKFADWLRQVFGDSEEETPEWVTRVIQQVARELAEEKPGLVGPGFPLAVYAAIRDRRSDIMKHLQDTDPGYGDYVYQTIAAKTPRSLRGG